jgi:prepilin-type N-terminal cleavage/methylation domain-containing protein
MNCHLTKTGFTLIELATVIAIIGIFSSVILTEIKDTQKKGSNAVRQQETQQYVTALELFRSKYGGYPDAQGNQWKCLGIKQGPHGCMDGETGNYKGNNALNAQVGEFIPGLPRNDRRLLSAEGDSYNGYAYMNPDTSKCSGTICDNFLMKWYLEGVDQNCGIGVRTQCGTSNPSKVTQCMYQVPQPASLTNVPC